jgi:DNA adenine methylase
MRSPFRYPGGKTWLVPWIREWIRNSPQKPTEFVEPFAGGAIIGLTVGFENLADHVILVELDDQVASVWQTILNDDAYWLADQISSFDLTPQNVQALFSATHLSVRERAFQAIVKNRVNRGGILAPGAGMVKHGEAGKGIRSRWYPDTLRKRIVSITLLRDRFTFIHGDGLEAIRQNASKSEAMFLIDPPYTAAGKKAGRRLYAVADLDHQELFKTIASVRGDFLMTYDNTDYVRDLAAAYSFEVRAVTMKNTHHTRMTELLIGRDLGWVP